LFEIDEVFIVLKDLDICEGTPGVLNFFSSDLVFRLLCELASSLLVPAPSPLDLNRRDVIHSETMVLEQASGQGHLIRRLDQACTEVAHALLFILGHHIEGRCQELLSQALSC